MRWGLCIACALILGGLDLLRFDPLRDIEHYTIDLRHQVGRKAPIDERLVFIGITGPAEALEGDSWDPAEDASGVGNVYRQLQGEWPFPRSVWAGVIDSLAKAGANVVALDLLFVNEGEGDLSLAASLKENEGKVVLGSNFIDIENATGGTQVAQQLPNPWILQSASGTAAGQDPRVGFVNIWTDRDGVLRSATYRLREGEIFRQEGWTLDTELGARVQESFAARVLRQAGLTDTIPDGTGEVLFRYAAPPGSGFRPHLLKDVFHPRVWKNTYQDGEFFKDKIVVVGPYGNFFQDLHTTPFEFPSKDMPGPEVHLNMINAAIHGEFLKEISGAGALPFVAASAFLAGWISLRVQRMGRRFLLFAAVTLGFLILCQISFNHLGLILPVAVPLLVLNLSGILILGSDFVTERINRLKIRTKMGFYFSPDVLEEVLNNPSALTAKKAEVTLLLTDLRNSTDLSEQLGLDGMFNLLNSIFEIQTRAVLEQHGSLEHFLGDQFLSYWGAPKAADDGADRALAAARKLIEGLEAFRKTLSPQTARLFGYGVGLHFGEALVGNKGSEQRLDYGLVGRTINVAARIEALTKYYGVPLIASDDFIERLTNKPGHRLLDRVIVKGASHPVDLYELESAPSTKLDAESLATYEKAWSHYQKGEFKEAELLFMKVLKEKGDSVSGILASRCDWLVHNPPGNWDGIWRMEGKEG